MCLNTHNPAGQIASFTRNNDGYAWTGAANVNRSYTTNGLNQHTLSGAVSLGYDARGNLTSSGSDSYGYSSENMMTSGPGITLSYDPLLRLAQTVAGTTRKMQYDGSDFIAEYDGSNNLQTRFVHGPGVDEPLVQYTVSSGARLWYHADERGSIVAGTNDSGAPTSANTGYDEYGIPAGTLRRFMYTGQMWVLGLGMYNYKARIYSPTLGRFMQTDPIGYGDGMNIYAYVRNDPVNKVDPSGLACDTGDTDDDGNPCDPPIFVNAPATNYAGLRFGGGSGAVIPAPTFAEIGSETSFGSTEILWQDPEALKEANKKYREIVSRLRRTPPGTPESKKIMNELTKFLNSADGRLLRGVATQEWIQVWSCTLGIGVAAATKGKYGLAKGTAGCALGVAFEWAITGGHPDPLTDPDL